MNLIAPLLAVTLAVVCIFDGLSFAKFLSRISGPRVVVGAVGNRIPPHDAGKAGGGNTQ